MSINDDSLMTSSSVYYNELEFLVNSVSDGLKKELRSILFKEIDKSNSIINLKLEKILRKISAESGEGVESVGVFDGASFWCLKDNKPHKHLNVPFSSFNSNIVCILISKVEDLQCENAYLKKLVYELEMKVVENETPSADLNKYSQMGSNAIDMKFDFSIHKS
jgi:hypothetical protein